MIAAAAFLLLTNCVDKEVVHGQGNVNVNAVVKNTDENNSFNKINENIVEKNVISEPLKIENDEIDTSGFKSAAISNDNLKNTLEWTFGKNRQIGWFLYVPLIQHSLKTEAKADSSEFAAAVAEWQKNNSLESNGILDAETMLGFVKFWQTKRLQKVYEADEATLFHAPIADFYDPTRDVNLLNVEKETYAAYKKMIAAAAKDLNLKIKDGTLNGDDKFLKIISAHRSRKYQEELRKKEPNAGRAQLAFTSPHFTGRALDIYVGGEPVTTKNENRAIQIETKAYKWLVANAEKFGFYNYFYEPWHWEYVSDVK